MRAARLDELDHIANRVSSSPLYDRGLAMIDYAKFRARKQFAFEEILAFSHGRLIRDPPEGFASRLPTPPFLMVDRITQVERDGNRGRIVAETDIGLDDWFFQCHFKDDPVQPGSLGLDAVWQLIGFYCAWSGAVGAGRALGCGEVVFEGQIRPRDRLVRYEINIRRFTLLAETGAGIAVGDAEVFVDDQKIYTIKKAKAGVFRDIDYVDYPLPTKRSRGGLIA